MSWKRGIYGSLDADALGAYKKLGIDAVFFDSASKEEVKQAKDEGFKIYVAVWAFRASIEEFGVEDVYGGRSLWAGAGCPNNPAVRENYMLRIKKALASLDVDGIVLDGVRFPSPGSGRSSFLTCFCKHCCRKAETLGYELSRIRRFLGGPQDPMAFFKTLDRSSPLVEWLDFRCDSITEHVKHVREHVGASYPEAEVGAAVFTPSLATLAGQRYVELGSILDFVQSMIYSKGEGLACINFELAKLVEGFSIVEQRTPALQNIYQNLGYLSFNPPSDTKSLIELGLPADVIGIEAKKAKGLVGANKARFTPIIFILGSGKEEFRKAEEQVIDASPDGVVYFSYHEGLEKILDGRN